MSAEASGRQSQTNASSFNQNESSDLNFTSSDSNNALPSMLAPRSPSKSTFQWPSEPLNQGRPSLPQKSQKSVDDANRDISERITNADQDATSQSQQSNIHPGLDHPRLSAKLADALNSIENDCRQQLSPTTKSFGADVTSSPSSMLKPLPQDMQRSSSNRTNKSAGSADVQSPAAQQLSSIIPDMFRNAATMPLNLLRSLIPDKSFSAAEDEGLSASTLQVPVASFTALFEACRALEWLASQGATVDLMDKNSISRRNSLGPQQQVEENADTVYFDYFDLLQKVADVVSGIAASKGIDLVLDLDPQLDGQPAVSQHRCKLGFCRIWADRVSLTFLFMSCISRLIHAAPVNSSVVITSTLTAKQETPLRPGKDTEAELMFLSLNLRLILPRDVEVTPNLLNGLSETPVPLLLDAFGARMTIEQRTATVATLPDRAAVDHCISLTLGQLPNPEDPESPQRDSLASKHIVGPAEQELVEFASSLNGKKVALYSSSQSIFARGLSKFLSRFGCEVAPVFSEAAEENSVDADDEAFGKQAYTAVAVTSGRPALVSYTSDMDRRAHSSQSPPANPPSREPQSAAAQATSGGRSASNADTAVLDPVTGTPVTFDNNANQKANPVVPFSYVIIDDDIVTLQKELLHIRSAVPILKSALTSKSSSSTASASAPEAPRPGMHHRTKSSPQVNRLMASQPDAAHSRSFGSLGNALLNGETEQHMDESVTQTIIFFTSIKSYRMVRDTVQPIIDSASFRGVSSPPEIMVLPKPAGAKRILTALHLTEHKPVVNLPFLPIATSPLSPLVSHSKSWWTPNASQKEDGGGIMTLTRRMTSSTDTDTAPPTPWSPTDTPRNMDVVPAPSIPLTSENLVLAGDATKMGQSANAPMTHPQDAAKDAVRVGAAPPSGTTTKSAPRSTAPRQTSKKGSSSQSQGGADETSAQQSPHAGSGANSAALQGSSVHATRSQQASTPMPAEALEYFSETAAKMGGSAASGMVIQSPDGRPAGIFFQPMAAQPGSKPGLSRGLSASSVRRSSIHSSSEHGDGPGLNSSMSDSAARERRMTNRSGGSRNGSGHNGNEGIQSRSGPLPTLSEKGSGAESTGGAPQLQVPNQGKYPSGSMFAPQVGIHSVLNSSRPPMTTPLGQNNSTTPQDSESPGNSSPLPGPEQAHRSNDHPKGGKGSSSEESAKPPATGAHESTRSGDTTASAVRKTPVKLTGGSKSATASPNARAAPNAAHRLQGRQSLGNMTASPADARSKPSAVPQSGFMMGMGFTASARRGRGPKKAPVREAVLPPIKVLIVEDNPINQRILSMFMGKKKIKYDVANNGREAVEKWKTGGYHLILMDIQLPVMDGIEATKEIRKLERNANIGILPNTPPASAESRVVKSGSPSKSSLSGGSRTVTSERLVKQAIAGSDSVQPAASDGPDGSLVNGVGDANRITTSRTGTTNPFRASVIIVALTASVLSSDRVEALAAGCNDFLNKPVSLPWLNQKILEWGSMMYLMYSGLSAADVSFASTSAGGAAVGGAGGRSDKVQMHLGFGYGPAEKAKALANNLHLGDTLAQKKKVEEREKQQAGSAEQRQRRQQQVAERDKQEKKQTE